MIPSLDDVGRIPNSGQNVLIIAQVGKVLHFRLFDRDGSLVEDTDETRLMSRAGQLEELRSRIETSWPPREMTRGEMNRIIESVESLCQNTQLNLTADADVAVNQDPSLGPDIHDLCNSLLECLKELDQEARLSGKKFVGWARIYAIKILNIPYRELVQDDQRVGALKTLVSRVLDRIGESPQIAALTRQYDEFYWGDDRAHRELAESLARGILDWIGNEPT